MKVAELRNKLLEKVGEAAASGDEETTARVMSYARVLLISMAGQPAHGEVDVLDLSVGTRTAALILGMHSEYVRTLIRTRRLEAAKSNGEFSIPLGEIVRFMEIGFSAEIQRAEKVRKMAWPSVTGLLRPWPPESTSETGTA